MFEHKDDWEERNRLMTENEKLRAELARIREMPRVQTLIERDALKAEVQRLRGALERIQSMCGIPDALDATRTILKFAANALQATESKTP